MRRVLMAAAEAAPFVKSGGLADVMGSLPEALAQQGCDVRVIMPKYEDIPHHFVDQMIFLTSFVVQVGWRRQHCGIFVLKHRQVVYYFIDNEWYFRRRGLYGYGDDAERFAYFSEAVLESLSHIGWVPHVVHAHDWHAALVPVFLKSHYANRPSHAHIKSIFTIHNIRYQGAFGRWVMNDLLNLGPEHDHSGALECHGATNFMKGGIVYSDWVTTVSPTYALEIQTASYGEGLHDVLWHRQATLTGITNGIDTLEYDLLTDRYLPSKSDTGSFWERKQHQKAQLQSRFGLPVDPNVPIVAMVTRLVAQKGIDLVLYIADELLAKPVQLVILGAGDAHYEHALRAVEAKHPTKAAVRIAFEESLSRLVYAGADAFLMPSQFEPCGIGQLIAMRYGTVPIVRATGGLHDTVTPYNEMTGTGHGFTFVMYNGHDVLDAVRRTLAVYSNPSKWGQVKNNAVQQDWSWSASAGAYAQLYATLIGF